MYSVGRRLEYIFCSVISCTCTQGYFYDVNELGQIIGRNAILAVFRHTSLALVRKILPIVFSSFKESSRRAKI